MNLPASEQTILQKHLARFIVEDVFNLPTGDQILRVVSPQEWYYKGNQMPEGQIAILRSQASKLLDGDLWVVLRDAIRHDAITRGVIKSQTEADQIAAKIQLRFIEIFEGLLRRMAAETTRPGG